MNTRALIGATVAVLAFSPLAAIAGGADEGSKEWLASLKSTRSVQEVRAEARSRMEHGEQHPVEVAKREESARSRAEVKADLARHGAQAVGA